MTLPSTIWRILMILDLLPGTDDLQRLHADEHDHVWGLSVVQVACGSPVPRAGAEVG